MTEEIKDATNARLVMHMIVVLKDVQHAKSNYLHNYLSFKLLFYINSWQFLKDGVCTDCDSTHGITYCARCGGTILECYSCKIGFKLSNDNCVPCSSSF